MRWERPDLVLVAFRGPSTAADAERIKTIYIEISERAGPFDVIFDVSDLALEPGARAAWTHGDKPYPLRHVVVFGANFAARTMVMTVYRAGRLIAPARFPFQIEFAATEEEARARIRGRVSSPTA